jgi:branched-chain amino acid transport system ATP-binding protein
MAILELRGLSKNFGSNQAVNTIDLEVKEGQIRGLIGPNGSGKTTVFNLISGFLRPSAGRVIYQGKDITNLPPHKIVAMGLARTFQLTALFKELTVLQNVVMCSHLQSRTTLWQQFWRDKKARYTEKSVEIEARSLLDQMGIEEIAHEIAGELPHGHAAALGIANALATRPKMILLDEPVGGMNPMETNETMARIRHVRDQGITLLLVEHDMKAVLQTCDEITCINFGTKLCEGSPQTVCSHPEVVKAYLGEEMNECFL